MVRFFSNKLNREIRIEHVPQLNRNDLQVFHSELKTVVEDLTNTINEANERKQTVGLSVDSDWLHRVSTKRRIALKFVSECYIVLKGGSTANQRQVFERIYRSKFRDMLEEEFGKEELAAIEAEITAESTTEYVAWLTSTNQSMWFKPKSVHTC